MGNLKLGQRLVPSNIVDGKQMDTCNMLKRQKMAKFGNHPATKHFAPMARNSIVVA